MAVNNADYVDHVLRGLRNEMYIPSREEFEAIQRCKLRVKSNFVQAFIATGAVLWSVTGRMKLMPRLLATFTGASMGSFLSGRWSAEYCTEEFLTLDGTHLQEKIMAILQMEALSKPRTRATLEKYYYIEPLYDDDFGHTSPNIFLRKKEVLGVGARIPRRQMDVIGRDQGTGEDPHEAIKSSSVKGIEDATMIHAQKITSQSAFIRDDLSEDPFRGWFSNDAEDSSNDTSNTWKRRHKMRVVERRDFNRAQYLQWQEKRNASKWADAQNPD